MNQNERPEAPKPFYNYKSKHILAIAFGIIAVVVSTFGFIQWSIYLFSIGFALASILFAYKYFEMEKLPVIAAIVATSAALVVGYSIIRTELVYLVDAINTATTTYDYYNNEYDWLDDYFNSDNSPSQDYGLGSDSNDGFWD